tara:strand:+ start:192 stop:1025 length:834 start_codon:yes stop_codon:yes gene_type:complete
MKNHKYVICGIDSKKGCASNDSSHLYKYFELGWECSTTYFFAKRLLQEKKITTNDTIVTCSGREFLYKSVFNKVISWSDFTCILNNLEPTSEILNLVDSAIKDDFKHLYDDQKLYRFLEEDKNILQSFEKSSIKTLHDNKPYNIIVFRQRDHVKTRNTSESYIQSCIDTSNKFYKTFIVGYGCDVFDNCKPVNLQDYCTLINNKLCNCILTPQTGPVTMARIFSKAKTIVNYSVDGDESIFLKNHPIISGYPEHLISSNIIKLQNAPSAEILHKFLC